MLSRVLRWWRDRARRHPDLPEAMATAMVTLAHRFEREGIDFALVGGLALALHGIERATKDVDFIVDRDAADRADALLIAMGFERLQRNDTFGNYLLDPLRVDLLFTKGEHSRRMLAQATEFSFRNGTSKVVAPEDLIGLKLQALANNPARPHDRGDIEALLRLHGRSMNLALVRDYFILFERESELDELLDTIGAGSTRDPQSGS